MSVNCIVFRFPALPGVCCAFQTRGNSAGDTAFAGNISFSVGDDADRVRANRQELLDHLRPYGLESWAELQQIHGDGFIVEPERVSCAAEPKTEGDGMATTRPGQGLLIKTADCQPILLAHKGGRHVAALHAGWRGNRCNFPLTAVARFCERYDLRPADLVAVRGPSLGPERAEFINFEREWGEDFRPWFDPASKTMDLWGLTRSQLQEAGLPARQIYGLDLCTMSNHENFFSYRQSRQTGRQASLIWICPE